MLKRNYIKPLILNKNFENKKPKLGGSNMVIDILNIAIKYKKTR